MTVETMTTGEVLDTSLDEAVGQIRRALKAAGNCPDLTEGLYPNEWDALVEAASKIEEVKFTRSLR